VSNPPSADPDPEDVLAAFGWAGGHSFRRLAQGWDNLIWRFETPDGRAHTLRLYRDGVHRAAAAANETAALRFAAAQGLPAPALEAAGEFEGRPALILSWAEGKTLADLAKARPWRIGAIGRAMGRLQARVHATPLPPEGFPRTGREWIERAVPQPALREAVAAAARLDTFCHLDFHPLNVVGAGTRPTAILDWINAAVSDARIDLAYTKATLVVSPPMPGDPPLVLRAARRLLARAWERGYAEAAGSFPLDPLFEAFGVARMAVQVDQAVAEGRGWATPAGAAAVHEVLTRKLRAAGIG
jgi:aminoglycoside phosphotransferase (APT) family kinase protein